MPPAPQLIRVRNESSPAKVAGAIAHAVRQREFAPALHLEVCVIGERAMAIAIKALARAQTYLAQERPDLFLGFNAREEALEVDALKLPGFVFTIGWVQL
jgi:stage V sporulation protein SpoVS